MRPDKISYGVLAEIDLERRDQQKLVPLSALRGGAELQSALLQSSPVEALLRATTVAVGEIAARAGCKLSRLALHQGIAYHLAEEAVELATKVKTFTEVNQTQKELVEVLKKQIATDNELLSTYEQRVTELETAAAKATLTTV